MDFQLASWTFLRKISEREVAHVLAIALAAQVLVLLAQGLLRRAAERAEPHRRLAILRIVPLARLSIRTGAAALALPILVEPTTGNIVAVLAATGLAIAFAFKDYASSIVAGLVTVFEGTYQPGDWIEVDGAYGEVRSIDLRAVRIVTADDTEVIVPHARLWSASVHNATSGQRSLLCVTDFYLNADHDAAEARRTLAEVAGSSAFRKPESAVTVIVLEKPWGTHYRVKAYVRESREQFLLMSDVTVRGKQALRELSVRFAQAPIATLARGK